MDFLLQAMFVGIIKGSIYVIIALSMVIIYKSSEVFNFAVGEFCTLGAIMFFFAARTGLPLPLVFLLFVILCGLAGMIIEKIVIQPLMGRDPLSTTLVTIGLSSFLVGLFQITIGSTPISLEIKLPVLMLEIGDLFLTSEQVWSMIFAVLAIGLLLLFYQFSRWGIIMRATAEGQVKAMVFGINTRYILTLTWAIAAIVAAMGGLVVAWSGTLTYNMGIIGLVAIPVVLVAGLDSIGGCIIGGILIGVVESLTSFYFEDATGLKGFRSVTPYLFLLIVLMIRPTGLFGQVRIERV